MNTEQLRADFEAWWESTPILKENKRTIAEKAYQAGRAALQSQTDAGWKEAFKAWNVCASIHREWAKGKDAVFTTRQADFVWNAENAFKKACGAAALQSQDREGYAGVTVWMDGAQCTKIITRIQYESSSADELLRHFEAARAAIYHARRIEGENHGSV